MKKINEIGSREDWFNYAWSKIINDVKSSTLSIVLDSLLTSYEKQIIVNRVAALILIKEGKTYKQIGEELWLSPTTIRSLKKMLEGSAENKYTSYRFSKNKLNSKKEIVKANIHDTSFIDWVDYCASVFPKRNGPRWKHFKIARA